MTYISMLYSKILSILDIGPSASSLELPYRLQKFKKIKSDKLCIYYFDTIIH